ncbi:GDSL-type esterase/lipase family protein [Flavobacterium psychrophilum]|uniref:GDSL-type esterase/lipase family protein n=2 Tax=Flavobacterium psychrophilum TaxID=96345 RepID=UPI000618786C|nr:GDSL-type esterase/lipase family protein [Flavobacterium psychrophilum]OAE92577.1 hypothetical protein SU65_06695 [Flavobacterium psychrophilum]OUD27337.1 hypothetical protein FPG92_08330 [Flavobacterium psychrophilum]
MPKKRYSKYNMISKYFSVVLLLVLSTVANAQDMTLFMTKNLDSLTTNLTINKQENNIKNKQAMLPLLQKLYRLKSDSLQKVTFIHIGDSHIQADMMTEIIRTEMQKYYGNAGRGFVFPYQLANSNTPSDYIFSSSTLWKGNRLIKKDTTLHCGVSGFCIENKLGNHSINFRFRKTDSIAQYFNKITLFSSKKNCLVNDSPFTEYTSDGLAAIANFTTSRCSFNLKFTDTSAVQIQGLVLENTQNKGVLYNSIGVNGAKFSDYNQTPLFWKQLNHLKGDCYIFSMGTNEAQNYTLTPEIYTEYLKNTVNEVRQINPEAVILFTFPPASYYQKKAPNAMLIKLSNCMQEFCNNNNIAYWDLFTVTNQLKGAVEWKNKSLLRPDLVHFSKKGYQLQGLLFVEAFAQLWNNYIKTANK